MSERDSSIRSFNQSLPMLLLRAREVAMDYFRPSLQEHNVTEQQWRVLRALNETQESTAAGLSSRCAILAPSMTRILRTLTKKGWISVKRGSEDHRELRVRLTRAGRTLIARVGPISESQYELIRQRMRPERMDTLYKLLDEFIHMDEHEASSDKMAYGRSQKKR